MNSIASENQSFFNSIIGNTNNRNTAKLITFYKTHSSLGLLISKAHIGSHVVVANNGSSNTNARFEVSFLKVKLYHFE